MYFNISFFTFLFFAGYSVVSHSPILCFYFLATILGVVSEVVPYPINTCNWANARMRRMAKGKLKISLKNWVRTLSYIRHEIECKTRCDGNFKFWQPIYSEKYKYNKNAKKYEKEVEEEKGEHIQYTGSDDDDDGWIAEPWSIFKKAFSIFGKHQASWQMANCFAIYSKITIRNQKQIKLEPTVEHVVGLVDSLECLRMYVCVYICYIWYV